MRFVTIQVYAIPRTGGGFLWKARRTVTSLSLALSSSFTLLNLLHIQPHAALIVPSNCNKSGRQHVSVDFIFLVFRLHRQFSLLFILLVYSISTRRDSSIWSHGDDSIWFRFIWALRMWSGTSNWTRWKPETWTSAMPVIQPRRWLPKLAILYITWWGKFRFNF